MSKQPNGIYCQQIIMASIISISRDGASQDPMLNEYDKFSIIFDKLTVIILSYLMEAT